MTLREKAMIYEIIRELHVGKLFLKDLCNQSQVINNATEKNTFKNLPN